MTVEELIQLIRQLNVAQIRAELEHLQRTDSEHYLFVQAFYECAYRQPK